MPDNRREYFYISPPRKLKLFVKKNDGTKFKERIFIQICKTKKKFPKKFIPYDEHFLKILESKLSSENVAGIVNISNDGEKERIDIISEILEKKGGYDEAEAILKRKRMRQLYTRSPFELALVFCLKYNDANNNDKYNLDDFIRLLKKMKIGINSAGTAKKMPDTLAELRKVILENTSLNEKNTRETVRYTQSISSMLNDVNYSSRKDAEIVLRRILDEKISLMVNAQESIRYYLCKYIYHILSSQIIEMQKIIFELRGKKENYITDYLTDMRNKSCNVFSYRYRITCNEKFDECIFGSSFTSMNPFQFVLYLTGDTLMLKGLDIRDKTYLLSDTEPAKKADAEFYKNFNESVLSCFKDYSIDYKKLFSLVFYENSMMSVSDKEKESFMKSLLTGESDLSRTALIWFLMNARASLENNSTLTDYNGKDKEDYLLFYKDYDEIDFSRVNYILRSVGYYPLSVDNPDADFEKIKESSNISAESMIEQLYGLILRSDIDDIDKNSALIEALTTYYENNDIFDYDIINLKARSSYHRPDELRKRQ